VSAGRVLQCTDPLLRSVKPSLQQLDLPPSSIQLRMRFSQLSLANLH